MAASSPQAAKRKIENASALVQYRSNKVDDDELDSDVEMCQCEHCRTCTTCNHTYDLQSMDDDDICSHVVYTAIGVECLKQEFLRLHNHARPLHKTKAKSAADRYNFICETPFAEGQPKGKRAKQAEQEASKQWRAQAAEKSRSRKWHRKNTKHINSDESSSRSQSTCKRSADPSTHSPEKSKSQETKKVELDPSESDKKKMKPNPPVQGPKKLSKKQLLAEQKRREKEMREIAVQLEEQRRLDEEREERRREKEVQTFKATLQPYQRQRKDSDIVSMKTAVIESEMKQRQTEELLKNTETSKKKREKRKKRMAKKSKAESSKPAENSAPNSVKSPCSTVLPAVQIYDIKNINLGEDDWGDKIDEFPVANILKTASKADKVSKTTTDLPWPTFLGRKEAPIHCGKYIPVSSAKESKGIEKLVDAAVAPVAEAGIYIKRDGSQVVLQKKLGSNAPTKKRPPPQNYSQAAAKESPKRPHVVGYHTPFSEPPASSAWNKPWSQLPAKSVRSSNNHSYSAAAADFGGGNVWVSRQKLQQAVPTSAHEEEEMLRVAMEMSHLQAAEDDLKRSILVEEQILEQQKQREKERQKELQKQMEKERRQKEEEKYWAWKENQDNARNQMAATFSKLLETSAKPAKETKMTIETGSSIWGPVADDNLRDPLPVKPTAVIEVQVAARAVLAEDEEDWDNGMPAPPPPPAPRRQFVAIDTDLNNNDLLQVTTAMQGLSVAQLHTNPTPPGPVDNAEDTNDNNEERTESKNDLFEFGAKADGAKRFTSPVAGLKPLAVRMVRKGDDSKLPQPQSRTIPKSVEVEDTWDEELEDMMLLGRPGPEYGSRGMQEQNIARVKNVLPDFVDTRRHVPSPCKTAVAIQEEKPQLNFMPSLNELQSKDGLGFILPSPVDDPFVPETATMIKLPAEIPKSDSPSNRVKVSRVASYRPKLPSEINLPQMVRNELCQMENWDVECEDLSVAKCPSPPQKAEELCSKLFSTDASGGAASSSIPPGLISAGSADNESKMPSPKISPVGTVLPSVQQHPPQRSSSPDLPGATPDVAAESTHLPSVDELGKFFGYSGAFSVASPYSMMGFHGMHMMPQGHMAWPGCNPMFGQPPQGETPSQDPQTTMAPTAGQGQTTAGYVPQVVPGYMPMPYMGMPFMYNPQMMQQATMMQQGSGVVQTSGAAGDNTRTTPAN